MKLFSLRQSVVGVLAVVGALASSVVQAESVAVNGAGALNASARLDFRITVPKILYLRVGSGTNLATDATVNLIDFTVGAGSVGNATAVNATAGSGDLGLGIVTARVVGNGGNISFTSTTIGALLNATGESIPFSQIGVTPSVLTSVAPLAHPTLVANGGTSAATTLTAVNRVVNQDARWQYTYLNSNVVAAGTYGGVNVNNGRVTYTASLP